MSKIISLFWAIILILIAILFANSVNASILSFIFSIEIIFFEILVNITITFLLYFLFARMFKYLKPMSS